MPNASEKAIALIVSFEVTSQAFYEAKYRSTIWPEGSSGVTIGIGYDVGYVTKAQLTADWASLLPAEMIAKLATACGVKGIPARALAASLKSSVDVPWAAANTVFRQKNMPAYSAEVVRALPNTDRLSGDSFGALVSLTFNRGASYSRPGDRYREMRAIKAHMASGNLAAIPNEIRGMKRLWPTVNGLKRRRDAEAALFAEGLQSV